ncbi:MAG: prepilin-type N-terminal cleavage/methylation domain-containing protein [Burkholderiaceae bacterium]|nr:prepilin-type N-terminal cleavage/methylation domain-containing protein [Burkholderiaceae bacterium]
MKKQSGFTLLELLVVIAIMALATAGVSLSLRDGGQAQLEREAERLAALLEAGRAQSRASGVPVRWRVLAQGGFRFEGLPQGSSLPQQWLDARTTALGADILLLGPEPLIAPQQVVLTRADLTGPALRVTTDGLHPFHVEPLP